MHVCVYVGRYMCVCVFVCAWVYVYVIAYMCMCIWHGRCVWCIWCVCVYMWMCMYMCRCMFLSPYMGGCVWGFLRACVVYIRYLVLGPCCFEALSVLAVEDSCWWRTQWQAQVRRRECWKLIDGVMRYLLLHRRPFCCSRVVVPTSCGKDAVAHRSARLRSLDFLDPNFSWHQHVGQSWKVLHGKLRDFVGFRWPKSNENAIFESKAVCRF